MRRAVLLLGACASLVGCDFDRDLKNWRPPDAGADAGPVDAGFDGGTDAGLDAGSDAGDDAGVDGGFDAGWVFAPDGSYNFAFVSSVSVAAVGITPAAADAICTACARDAGLPGIFAAWLGVSTDNAYDRAGIGSLRGWVRPDRKPFADTASDLTNGRTLYPLRLDEHGLDVGTANILSGANSFGTVTDNCSDWTQASGMQFIANTQWSGDSWASALHAGCLTPGHLFCFGIDQNAPVTVSPAAGKRVFLSSDWVEDGGLAGADEHCTFDAWRFYDAGMPFIAVLATQSAGAASRFDSAYDGGWVRPDGVWVGDLRTSQLYAPLLVTADQSVAIGYATGALSPAQPGTFTSTCDDYTSPGGIGAMQGLVQGNENALGPEWFADVGNSFICGEYKLVCAEP